MDPILIQNIESYNGQNHEIGDQIIKEMAKINADFSRWLKDVQQKKELIQQEFDSTNEDLIEVEKKFNEMNFEVQELEKIIEEKKFEIKKLDGLNQMYLLRKQKATARLSQNDEDFLESLEKRHTAFKQMTGIIWDYKTCDDRNLSGYVTNAISKRVKLFQGELSTSDIWHLIEKISK